MDYPNYRTGLGLVLLPSGECWVACLKMQPTSGDSGCIMDKPSALTPGTSMVPSASTVVMHCGTMDACLVDDDPETTSGPEDHHPHH